MNYNQLTEVERYQIYSLLKTSMKPSGMDRQEDMVALGPNPLGMSVHIEPEYAPARPAGRSG